MTLILIGANLASAFALLFQPDLAFEFGFRPDHPRLGAVFTSLFLHANVIHLLGNMIFLAAVGAAVELATGSIRFAAVYFVSGLVGVLAHFAMTRHQPDPAPYIGASGAIAGCAGYYSVRYTRLKVPLAPRFGMTVLAVTILWVVLQVAGAFIRVGDSGGTAYWAHIGGFLTGIAISFIFRSPDLGQLKLGHAVLERMNDRGPAAVALAAQRHLTHHPADVKALWELADAYELQSEQSEEASTLLQLLDLVGSEDQTEVLRRLAQIGYISRVPMLRRLQLADQCKATSPFVARALLRSVVDGPRDELQRPDAMLSLIALELEHEPARAEELLSELEQTYPLHATVDLARKRGWLG